MPRSKHTYASAAADQIESFVAARRAADSLSLRYEESLHLFDAFCVAEFPDADGLTQGMVDRWCEPRPTECANSCRSRCSIVVALVEFLRERGETDVVPPELPRWQGTGYVPHAFTDDELRRLFAAADSIVPYKNRVDCRIRKIQCVAFFRLLYSSGIRTTEARLLRREDADLKEGVLSIRHSKGPDQHYVALHPSMVEVLRAYDEAAERLQPGREWLFESSRGGHLSRRWVVNNFKKLWEAAGNGDTEGIVPYQLRHEYATRNIMSWDGDAFDAHDRLLWLSRSMGHRSVQSTLHYFSLVPAISDKILEATGERMDEIIPDVWEWEEADDDGR